MRYKNKRDRKPQQAGFSLIELMVGMVVAMVAMIIVAQIFKMSEGSRRTTTGGDDAQTVGAIAMTELQRELRQAGQGLMSANLLGCDLTVGTWTISGLAPLTINPTGIPAGDTNTDTLLIAYGSSFGSPEGDRVNAQTSSNTYAMTVSSSFHLNDWVIATPASRATPCALQLDQVTSAPVAPNVTVKTGMAGLANGVVFNLGPTPRVVAYAVRNGHLTSCDYLAVDCSKTKTDDGQWVEVADGIASLRVVYGRDTSSPPDGQLDGYDQITPTKTTAWSCVLAARLVVVARSGQLEKTAVTATAPEWAASSAAAITLSGNSDWQLYRYKTFETIVPLRNVAWQGTPSTCS